ncbi:MAG: (cytosine-5)-methyltransferase 1 [Actinomycetota bacterium]|jgi:DNA (cytosine-5)-methyltransferase 1|nr:(cytosine-5)-methyltransferase 1 [Actinomycetota bacterium]
MRSIRRPGQEAGIQLSLGAGPRVPANGARTGNTGAMPLGAAISLFSGAGGMDLGVEAAGFSTVSAVEWDEDAADTMEKNAPRFFPNLGEVLRADLYPLAAGSDRGLTTRDILAAGGLSLRNRPELLIGGPPCVAFSKSGFWLDWKRDGFDPAATLLQAYTRVLAEARPRFFILENVYALTFDNRASRPAFTRLLSEIEAAGYRSHWKVLNAADYGVPQARPRLFIVGCRRGDTLPELPRPTHHGTWERRRSGDGGLLPHVTSGAALDGLSAAQEPEETVRGQWAHLLPEIPPGDNYLYFTAERGHPDPIFEWRSRYWSFLLKLSPDKPSPTIQARPGPNVGPFHWDNRRLRAPELRRLFTFPDDFDLVGRRASVQAQVGNSVPPRLAEQVARAVAACL